MARRIAVLVIGSLVLVMAGCQGTRTRLRSGSIQEGETAQAAPGFTKQAVPDAVMLHGQSQSGYQENLVGQ
jgi:hypothetical protein